MWKAILLIFPVSFAVAKTDSSAEISLPEVPCRLYFDFYYVASGAAHVCLLDRFKIEFTQKYRIKSEQNEKVTAIDIRNYKIRYGPSFVGKNFPNMEVYAATANAIVEVGPENFQGLTKLKALYLSHNYIEEIPAGTFAGLVSLQHLHLQYNKIKFIDTTALTGLNQLIAVHADHNVCIDEKFLKDEVQQKFSEAASNLCNGQMASGQEANKDEL